MDPARRLSTAPRWSPLPTVRAVSCGSHNASRTARQRLCQSRRQLLTAPSIHRLRAPFRYSRFYSVPIDPSGTGAGPLLKKVMGDHVMLHVDRLIAPETTETIAREEDLTPSSESGAVSGEEKEGKENIKVSEEEEPLIQTVDCRICQEEDHLKNLEAPCACSGSLKYAHRACVQRWCNEKGDITCEICHEVSPSSGGSPLDFHDPRVLAMAAARRQLVDDEYDEYATNASGAAFCRSAALILMALLLLRHAMSLTNANGDEDDASAFFSVSFSPTGCWISLAILCHGLGYKHLATPASKTGQNSPILLPYYVQYLAETSKLFSMDVISLNCKTKFMQYTDNLSQLLEAAALAATELAFILQSGRQRGLHLTLAPDSPATPHQDPEPES
ncbi:hypothetical protein ZIOFF_049421 [Zingiber officinale]|uniref:RING-CH-type domain-containing protein n=1 Tax=Zingiber officinale TaxID=94328 RepID=A0A8J5FSQ0_ZINOF|nr:hypothetical protein ZIOFF_049421 [Zingiber officinale]